MILVHPNIYIVISIVYHTNVRPINWWHQAIIWAYVDPDLSPYDIGKPQSVDIIHVHKAQIQLPILCLQTP